MIKSTLYAAIGFAAISSIALARRYGLSAPGLAENLCNGCQARSCNPPLQALR
jgi:hypothetical protein